jgi:outer membrane protein
MKFRTLLTFVTLLGCGSVFAQDTLRLEDAVRIALEKNYDIRISRNDVAIAENNVNRANAGMIPAVTGSLSSNRTIQNSSQTRATGEVTERNGARGSTLNYGVALGWTIFDGFGMFARYDQLKELQRLGESNFQLTVVNTVGNVLSRYFDIVQREQQLRAYDTAVAISRLRVTTARNRFEVGKAARLELLNAQVDYNTDTTNYLRQLQLVKTSKIALNELLARDPNTNFEVPDDFAVDSTLALGPLLAVAQQKSPALQAALISQRVAELDLRIVKADRYPVIGVNTGYNFNRNESALGFATLNTGRGLNYGLTASINIFNGFLQRRAERNAGIAIESAQLDYQRINQSVNAQLSSAYQTYLTNLALVKLEENNVRLARQNLDITMARYRLGTITQVEIRDAQLNYVNATVRLNDARYQAKLAEVSLRTISGSLDL